MPVRRLVVPLAVCLFVVVQVALLRQLLGDTARPRHQARYQERRLQEQLQTLRGSLAEVQALHRRVQRKLGDLGLPAPPTVGDSTRPGDGAAARAVAPAGSTGGQAKKLSLADLAETVRQRSEEGADAAAAAAPEPPIPTVPSHAPDGRQLIFPPGHEEGACVGGLQAEAAAAVAAVVTVTFDRPAYLRRHLDSLLAVHASDPANRRGFPLFVSQDGRVPNRAVAELAQGFGPRGVAYLHHRERAPPVRLLDARENLAYYRIAAHYRFVLRTFLDCFAFRRLIILEARPAAHLLGLPSHATSRASGPRAPPAPAPTLHPAPSRRTPHAVPHGPDGTNADCATRTQDDMELAPDFFAFFRATAPLLSSDPSLFCVSSWNDHGQARFVADESALLRSDFFPGLGWMLTAELWAELRDAWPKAYWDDWMRLDSVRRGRQCARPEVCRTYNFGARGASRGFYHKRFLAPIRLASGGPDWAAADLSFLALPGYDAALNASLAAARPVGSAEEAQRAAGDVVLRYASQEQYEALTGALGMLREWKDGVPRGGYRGVVTVRLNGGAARLFLAPAPGFRAAGGGGGGGNGTRVRTDATGALVRGGGRRQAVDRPRTGAQAGGGGDAALLLF